MFFVPSLPSENPDNVCENFWAGENPRLRLGFSLIWYQILQNVRINFHQDMKAHGICLISQVKKKTIN